MPGPQPDGGPSGREANMTLKAYALLIVAGALGAGCASAAEPVAAPAAPAPAVAPVQAAAPAIPLITQDALLEREARHDDSLLVIDVRSPEEFAKGHVPGAVNIPHDQIESRLADVPKDKDVVLYCHSGRRAGIAATVLKDHGYTRLSHLEGDMVAWQQNGRPLQVPAAPEGVQH
jgi:rhodanese-related sulfurtransferase